MTRVRRRILFFISAIIFIIAGGPLILYSFGYRFSLDDWKVLRAGGLFISSIPSTGTHIFVDGVLVKETSILSRSVFIQGLTPRAYTIRVEKDNYFPWQKSLAVLPERVTDVRALLVKDPPDGTVLEKGNYVSLKFFDTSETILILADPKKRERFYSIADRAFLTRLGGRATSSPEISSDAVKLIAEKKPKGYDYDSSQDRIIWWDNHTVWIRWLEGEEFLPLFTEKIEDLVFQTKSSIRTARFYPHRDAIIVALTNELRFVELDRRDTQNNHPLYKGKEPVFEVSQNAREAYILDGGNLIVMPLL